MAQSDGRSGNASAAPLPDTPDAIEIAMAAVGAAEPLPDIARTVLEKHARLLDMQAQELELKHISERVQAGLWLLLAAGAALAIALFITVAWRAAHTQALVVEPFAMPPALVQQGLSGEVAATRTLDEVKRMLNSRFSSRSPASYENDWGDDLKIDIPNTGLTLDQGWKLLRRTLGKETRFSGDVVQNGGAVTIAVRIAGGSARRFTAPTGDVDRLFVDAAEFVLRETQPYRFANYLAQFPERFEERRVVLLALTDDASPVERGWATLGLGNLERSLGNMSEADRWYRKVIADAPDFLIPYAGLSTLQLGQGRWQEALGTLRRMPSVSGSFQIDEGAGLRLRCLNAGYVATLARDRSALETADNCLTRVETRTGPEAGRLPLIKLALARMDHDTATAREIAPDASDLSMGGTVTPVERLMASTMRQLEVAVDTGDRAAAANLLTELDARERAATTSPETGPITRALLSTRNNPIRAEAEILLGHYDRAAALLANTPANCLPCTSARAKLAQAQGDLPGAGRWFIAAVRIAPSLPQPLIDRGRFLLSQQRWAAAEADFRAAERLSQGWADPQKYLGDALAAQGRRAEAKAAWAEAVRRAPKWREAQAALARATG